jgi:hypothetical protein
MESMERSGMSLWTHVQYGHPFGAHLTLQSELTSIAWTSGLKRYNLHLRTLAVGGDSD